MSSKNTKEPSPVGLLDRLGSKPFPHGSWVSPPLAAWCVYTTACVAHALHADPLYVAALAGLALVVAPVVAYLQTEHAERVAAWYAVACAASAGGWVLYSVTITPDDAVLAHGAQWLLIPLVVLGPLYGLLRKHKRREIHIRWEKQREQRAVRAQSDWAAIFEAAGIPGIVVADDLGTKSGRKLTVELADGSQGFHEIKQKERALALAASQRLSHQGLKISDNAIRVEKCEEARFIICHVQTKNFLATTLPYERNLPRRSINQPLLPAFYDDGSDVEFPLLDATGAYNTELVGTTGSGKSGFTNAMIAELTRCVDTVVWVCAVDKLLPLVAPWCRPWWDGRMDHCVFDWIAGQSQQEVLKMLAAMFHACDLRSHNPAFEHDAEAGPNKPAIVLIVEESTSALNNNTDKIRGHDGQSWTASQLLREITRLSRSGLGMVIRLDQFALMDSGGGQGNKIRRNTRNRVALATMSPSDSRAVLGEKSQRDKMDATELTDNKAYVSTSQGAKILPAKARYIEPNETKAVQKGLVSVAEVAIEHGKFQSGLDKATADGLGAVYAQRWNPERIHELLTYKAASMGHEAPTTPATASQAGQAATVEQEGPRTMPTNTDPSGDKPNMFGPAPDMGARMRQAMADRGLTPGQDPTGGNSGIDYEKAFAEIAANNSPRETGPVPEPLSTMLTALADDDREFISSEDLGGFCDMTAKQVGEALYRDPIGLNSQRVRRAEYDGKQTTGYLVADLRAAADRIRNQ